MTPDEAVRYHEALLELLVLSRHQRASLELGRLDDFYAGLDERESITARLAGMQFACASEREDRHACDEECNDVRAAHQLLLAGIQAEDMASERHLEQALERVRDDSARLAPSHTDDKPAPFSRVTRLTNRHLRLVR